MNNVCKTICCMFLYILLYLLGVFPVLLYLYCVYTVSILYLLVYLLVYSKIWLGCLSCICRDDAVATVIASVLVCDGCPILTAESFFPAIQTLVFHNIKRIRKFRPCVSSRYVKSLVLLTQVWWTRVVKIFRFGFTNQKPFFSPYIEQINSKIPVVASICQNLRPICLDRPRSIGWIYRLDLLGSL